QPELEAAEEEAEERAARALREAQPEGAEDVARERHPAIDAAAAQQLIRGEALQRARAGVAARFDGGEERLRRLFAAPVARQHVPERGLERAAGLEVRRQLDRLAVERHRA